MALPSKKRKPTNEKSLPNEIELEPIKDEMDLPEPSIPELPKNESENVFRELSQEELKQTILKEISNDNINDEKDFEEPKHRIPKGHHINKNKDTSPFYEQPKETLQEEDKAYRKKSEKYVDSKNMKIIPFGGNKVKSTDFDKRKNRLLPLKWFRILLVLFLIGLFALGFKNTIFPPNTYSVSEIESIANNVSGNNGFPKERGQAFAEQFLKFYLNLNNDDKYNHQMLGQFYSGEIQETGTFSGNRKVLGNSVNKQTVVGEPKTFEIISTTPESALYKVSALVTDPTGAVIDPETNLAKTKWVSFAINVYYNSKTGKLAITQDSPTRIPTYKIEDTQRVPKAEKIGTGEVESSNNSDILPTINGFLRGYAVSSVDNYDEILQYVKENPDKDLISGFDNQVELANPENPISDIILYKTENQNEWKADIKVKWKDKEKSLDTPNAEYTSRYVVTIKKTKDNKYLVTKFAPYLYIPSEINE